ncbi:LytTR family DNA-binding domain-containing protein [Sphingobacterium faecale]|uniref:LytTR family transcriptional regulator n=1 Tax=Sphingobacterium faecale TaxID=2803775 RepID=A0ABS1R7V9_9SPHI|nr:LytTR family DNA-binding domain-containing protein [Sphingobacterium faecale]MBL1410806.1 LytTR family transcriptional regulator [Sphingobacterium faecale]
MIYSVACIAVWTNRHQFHLVHSSLRKLLKALPAAKFCRIHQSYVINIEHIHDVDGSTVNLQNGMELKIGTHFRKAFLEKLLIQG